MPLVIHDYDNSLFSVEDEMIKDAIAGTNESFLDAKVRFHKQIGENGKTTYWQVIGGADAEAKTVRKYDEVLKSGAFGRLNMLFTPEILKAAAEMAESIGVTFKVGTSSPDKSIAEPMTQSLFAKAGAKMQVEVFSGTQAKLDALLEESAANPARRSSWKNGLIEDSWKITTLMAKGTKYEDIEGTLISRLDNSKAVLDSAINPNVTKARSTDEALGMLMRKMLKVEKELGQIKRNKSF